MLKQINEKHLSPYSRTTGYIDNNQVNQELSYYMESRPRVYGGCYVYQYITMKDGTVYELSSMTASSRGIVAMLKMYYNVKLKISLVKPFNIKHK